jgi:hypothetical protein
VAVSTVREVGDDVDCKGDTVTTPVDCKDAGPHACNSNSMKIIKNNPCRTLAVYHKITSGQPIIKLP